ncbi:A/G-specific adenine glycosylase [Urechidicola sp. KH5]
MKFSKTLIAWYLKNKRELPWRQTNNPYFIWLSEIILQQTRVDQGLDYYLRFIKAYPTVFLLANAKENEVLKLWQGLGYYSRARNLHASAKYIVDECEGKFPNTYNDIIKLKGVGDYTASAIASIAFNEPTAVVDGNVYRVLSRYFGVETPINSTNGIKEFKLLAQEVLNHKDPATHNQAIMEYGARICTPQKPNCSTCKLSDSCIAYAKNQISQLPIKLKKLKIRKRHFNYIVLQTNDGDTIIKERTGKGIWQNLYEFPLIEAESTLSIKELLNHKEFEVLIGDATSSIKQFNSTPIVHKLSHQHLYTTFWLVKCKQLDTATTSWKKVEDYPVPILIHNFIQELKASEFFSTFG